MGDWIEDKKTNCGSLFPSNIIIVVVCGSMIMSWVGMTRPLSIMQQLLILLVYIGALLLMFLENRYEKRIGFTDD